MLSQAVYDWLCWLICKMDIKCAYTWQVGEMNSNDDRILQSRTVSER